jgi:murein DD-endopeptidase MepM/ murein hydrolase activator NlpD
MQKLAQLTDWFKKSFRESALVAKVIAASMWAIQVGYVLFMEHRKRLVIGFSTAVVLGGGIFLLVQPPAFQVSLNGQPLFIASSKIEVQELVSAFIEEKKAAYGEHLLTRDLFTYEPVFAKRQTIASTETIEKYLNESFQLQVEAAVITVNDAPLVYLADIEAARQLVEGLKEKYSTVTEAETLKEIGFAENVDVRAVLASAEQLLSPEDALALIETGGEEPVKYVVKTGDTLWQIARDYNIYVEDIMIANNLSTDSLSLDQELTINQTEPYINVVATVEGSQNQTIPFATQIIKDTSVSGTSVKQRGEDGEKFVAYLDTRKNGITADRELLEETVLTEAKPQIVVQGNTAVTVASRSGAARVSGYSNPGDRSLVWPTNGIITQGYKGSPHPALDIANRSAPPIIAADEGIVSFAGTSGGYGRMITIDHGNGMVTRYAHCSSLSVSAGQTVSQGQQIGVMGSTGNSTGTHLHFEIIVNGNFQNPYNYLP